MAREDNERRLAAIMSTDVAGYSRLMGADETGTLLALKTLRKDVSRPRSPPTRAASSNSWAMERWANSPA